MTPPKPGLILETALYVDNLDLAAEFYGKRLGFSQIVRVVNRHVFYRIGAAVLLVFNPAETEVATSNPRLPVPPHGTRGPGHVCFSARAEQIEAWVALFQKNSIKIEADFRWPNEARSIYIRDPAGNSIEFAEPILWS